MVTRRLRKIEKTFVQDSITNNERKYKNKSTKLFGSMVQQKFFITIPITATGKVNKRWLVFTGVIIHNFNNKVL